jgi:hypothetical protein
MRDFKFFQKGTLDDPQMLDETTRATASFNADTPEGYMNRRMLYHTNRDAYERLRNPQNNNEMERYYYDHGLGRFETVRPTLNQEEVTRRINGGGNIHNDNHGNTDYVPFFTGGPRATKVNPKWWMKVKMFFQNLLLYSDQVFGIIFLSTLITIIVSSVIAKILNIW